MKLMTILSSFAGASLLFAGGYFAHDIAAPGAVREAAAPAAPQPDPVHVRFATTAPQLQYLRVAAVVESPEPLIEPLNGRISYDENYTARVSAPIAGRVTRLLAQPGDVVKAGQPLAELDAPDFAAAVADVHKSEADHRQKQLAWERARALLEGEVIARKDYESAETDLRQSAADMERARLRLRNLTQNASGVTADGRFVLRAPITGIVVDRQLNPGNEARPDAPNPLFTITDPLHLWALIDLPERYLDKVRAGQRVIVRADAYRDTEFPGRIANVGEVLDPATRRVPVRCVLDNPQRLLKPEMFARVVPVADESARLPRLPNGALISEGLNTFVFVEIEPGYFEKRKVTLGLQGRDETYVKEGLAAGDHVVVSGSLLLNSELASRQ